MVDVVNMMVWNQLRLILPAGTQLVSVRRTPTKQLEYIVNQSEKLGYKFARRAAVHDQSTWQGALDYLRSKNYKVAAPGRSPHQFGIAYDLSGPNLFAIEKSVRKAATEGRIKLSDSRSAVLREDQNNCVHVEIVGALLMNEAFVHFDRVA